MTTGDPFFLSTPRLQEMAWRLFQLQQSLDGFRDTAIGSGMWRLLWILAFRQKQNYATTQAVLAGNLRISRQALWRLCRCLQQRGLIAMLANADDRRTKLVKLTEAGWARVDAGIEEQILWLRSVWRTADVVDINGFQRIVRTLTAGQG